MNIEKTQQHSNPEETSLLESAVLSKLFAEKATPIPRWHFLLREYGVWLLWSASILFGAIAFAVTLFFMSHSGFAFYEATHDTPWDFIFDVLPRVWVLIFITMGIFAFYNLRHTKYGYRYRVWQVVLSSLLLSLVGGVLLNAFGAGLVVEALVAERVSMVESFERTQMRLWQSPQNGRLIGIYQKEGREPHSVFIQDGEGANWQLRTTDLNPKDLEILKRGELVHIIGMVSTTTNLSFHGCAVLPIPSRGDGFLSKTDNNRAVFIARMREHHQQNGTRNNIPGVSNSGPGSLCASHPVMKRIER